MPLRCDCALEKPNGRFFIREYLTADVQAAAFGARVCCPRGDLQTGRLIEPTRETALKKRTSRSAHHRAAFSLRPRTVTDIARACGRRSARRPQPDCLCPAHPNGLHMRTAVNLASCFHAVGQYVALTTGAMRSHGEQERVILKDARVQRAECWTERTLTRQSPPQVLSSSSCRAGFQHGHWTDGSLAMASASLLTE
jgi:hypothetical protein